MPAPSFSFKRPTLFAFDPKTGEYVGTAIAEVDHAALARDVVAFLQPAFTTADEPPTATAGVIAVWSGSSWSLVPDHRGQRWFSGDVPIIIDFLGDPAERGLSAEPPAREPGPEPDPLAARKQTLMARVTEFAQLGAAHTAIGQPVPQHVKDEMAEAVEELQKIDAVLKKKV